MRIKTVKYNMDGHTLILRNAEKTDVKFLLPFYKKICGETRFLLCEADECTDFTMEQEEQYIVKYRDSEKACLILAELDGQYVGNASFDKAGNSRRNAQVAFQKHINMTMVRTQMKYLW